MALVCALSALGFFGCMDMSEMSPPTDLNVSELMGGAHLVWKDNSDNEGGVMLERKVGSGAFATYKMLDFNQTQYHDTDVAAGTTYGYRVMAMPKSGAAHSGSTQYSNEVAFMLPAGS
jgi:hypothetical protein